MLSLYKLEIFNTVAIEGSFSKAAHRLLLTQPAVSQHIRDLESSLGRSLFDRGNRGVVLTPAGETLLDYTRCILRMVSDAENALSNLSEINSGQISIGATPGASVYLLPGWLQSFNNRFSQISASLRTDTTANIAAEILANHLDLGFVEGELQTASNLSVLELSNIKLCVVVSAAHPWAGQPTISVHAIDGQPFLTRPVGSQTRTWIEQIFAQYHIHPHLIAEFDNPEAIKQAVANGMGITILPDWSVNTAADHISLHTLTLENINLQRTLKLLWNNTVSMKSISRAFLSHLTDQFPQLTQVITSQPVESFLLPERKQYRASKETCTSNDRSVR